MKLEDSPVGDKALGVKSKKEIIKEIMQEIITNGSLWSSCEITDSKFYQTQRELIGKLYQTVERMDF